MIGQQKKWKCAQDLKFFRRIYLESCWQTFGRHWTAAAICSGFELEMKILLFFFSFTAKQNTQKSANTQHVLPCGSLEQCSLIHSSSTVLYPNDALLHTHWRASITLRKTHRVTMPYTMLHIASQEYTILAQISLLITLKNLMCL